MKIAFNILFFGILFTFISCHKIDPCEDILASTGPPIIHLTLVSVSTGENLFINGTYEANQILITDEQGRNIYFRLIVDAQYGSCLIAPQTSLNDLGLKKLFFKIDGFSTIELEVEIYKSSSECFSNYFARNYKALNYPFEIKDDVLIVKL